MITDKVIKEIYKQFSKPEKNPEKLELDRHLASLAEHHKLRRDGIEILVDDLEDFDPFHRFLIRNLCGVIEFDNWVAFIFPTHILFFSKKDNNMTVHFKPENKKKPSIFDRIFG